MRILSPEELFGLDHLNLIEYNRFSNKRFVYQKELMKPQQFAQDSIKHGTLKGKGLGLSDSDAIAHQYMSIMPLTLEIIKNSKYSQLISNPAKVVTDLPIDLPTDYVPDDPNQELNYVKYFSISELQPQFLLDEETDQFKRKVITDRRCLWEYYFLPFDLSDHAIWNLVLGCLSMQLFNINGTIEKLNNDYTSFAYILEVFDSRLTENKSLLYAILGGDETQWNRYADLFQYNQIKIQQLCTLKTIATNLTSKQFPYELSIPDDAGSAIKLEDRNLYFKLSVLILMSARFNYRDIQKIILEIGVLNDPYEILEFTLNIFFIHNDFAQINGGDVFYYNIDKKDHNKSEYSTNYEKYGAFKSKIQIQQNTENIEDNYVRLCEFQRRKDQLQWYKRQSPGNRKITKLKQVIQRIKQKRIQTIIDQKNTISYYNQFNQQISNTLNKNTSTQFDDIVYELINLSERFNTDDIEYTKALYNILRELPYLSDDMILTDFKASSDICDNLLVVNRKRLLIDYHISQFQNRSHAYFLEHSYLKYNKFSFTYIDNHQIQTKHINFQNQITQIQQIKRALVTQINRQVDVMQQFYTDHIDIVHPLLRIPSPNFHKLIMNNVVLSAPNRITDISMLCDSLVLWDQPVPDQLSSLLTMQLYDQTRNRSISFQFVQQQLSTKITQADHIIKFFVSPDSKSTYRQTHAFVQSVSETIILYNIINEQLLIKHDLQLNQPFQSTLRTQITKFDIQLLKTYGVTHFLGNQPVLQNLNIRYQILQYKKDQRIVFAPDKDTQINRFIDLVVNDVNISDYSSYKTNFTDPEWLIIEPFILYHATQVDNNQFNKKYIKTIRKMTLMPYIASLPLDEELQLALQQPLALKIKRKYSI